MKNKISNLKIIALIKEGKIQAANKMLRYYFSLSGPIVTGLQNGRKIGFPTINLHFSSSQLLPRLGCYLTITKVNQDYYFGLTCLIIKTNDVVVCETYLENFNQFIYKKLIKIFFLRFYRDNIAFASWTQIQALIKNDLKELQTKPKIDYLMLV